MRTHTGASLYNGISSEEHRAGAEIDSTTHTISGTKGQPHLLATACSRVKIAIVAMIPVGIRLPARRPA